MVDNYEVKKVNSFFDKYWVSKKSILLFFENYEKWIIREIKNNISNRAFENLFFRNFYFLIKNKKIELFLVSLIFLLKNKDKIFFLLNNYHYELIFRDYLEWKIIFRKEIYHILEENILYINKLNLKYENWISKLYNLNVFSINYWTNIKEINLNISIYNNELDIQDYQNSISINISSWTENIYNLSFYMSKDNLLISNLQFFKWSSKYIIISRYSKTLLYVLLQILNRLRIKNIISFSNENHPCKYHKISGWFKGDYNNILKNIWMKLDVDWYLYWNLDNLKIKGLNYFIKQNIDYNIKDIYKVLKI